MRLRRILISLAAAMFAVLPQAPLNAAEPDVEFAGSGWGHGVGMPQYGAKAMAQEGAKAQDIVEYYYTDAVVTQLNSAVTGWLVDDSDPLWVNLTGNTSSSLQQVSFEEAAGSLIVCQQEPDHVGSLHLAKNQGAYSPYVQLLEQRLNGLGFNPGPVDGWFDAGTKSAVESYQTSAGLDVDGIVGPMTKNSLFEAESGDRCFVETALTGSPATLTANADGTECTLQGSFAPGACVGSIRGLSTTNRLAIPERTIRNGNPIELARGTLRIRPDFDSSTNDFEGVHVLAEIDIDGYVLGIDEVILSWSSVANESLKAQAIASRSYGVGIASAIGPESSFSASRRDSCWCHLWSTTSSQVYAGYYSETAASAVWKTASDATAGLVLDHPSAGLVTAFFSSSSGGATEANEDAWGSSPVPYLRSVSDPWSLMTDPPFPNPYRRVGATAFDPSNRRIAKVGLTTLTGVAVMVSRNESGSADIVRFTGTSGGSEVNIDKSAKLGAFEVWLAVGPLRRRLGRGRKSPPPPPPSGPFLDISGNTFEADIIWAYENEITKGCNPPDNTLFCPWRTCEPWTDGRLHRSGSWIYPIPSTDYFDDDDSSIFETDINKLAEAGITAGCGERRYCPNKDVTREPNGRLPGQGFWPHGQ